MAVRPVLDQAGNVVRLDRLNIRASATVEGAVTNRVEVRRRVPKQAPSFRQDPARPAGFKVVSISVAPADLVRVDQLAAELGLSRSRLLVVAALAMRLTADEAALIALVRKMRRG